MAVVPDRSKIGRNTRKFTYPCYSPLLSSNKTSTFGRWSQFGNVDGDLSGGNPNTESVDEAPRDKHANILRSGTYNGADTPRLCKMLLSYFT